MASVRKRTWKTRAGGNQAWVVKYRDAKGVQRSEQFRTKTEANGRKVDIEGELRRGTHTAKAASDTLSAAGEAWIDAKEREGLERGTIKSYRSKLENHIYPRLGPRKIALLATPDIETFKEGLIESGVSIPQARKVLVILGMVLRRAQRRGEISVNPADGVRVTDPRRARRKARIVIPEKREVAEILKAAAPAPGANEPVTFAQAWAATAFFAGLRMSEQRGLSRKNVVLKGDEPGIRVVERADAWGTIGRCKTEAAYRFVPIGPQLAHVLRQWLLLNGDSDLVFSSDSGTPITPSNLHRRHWQWLFYEKKPRPAKRAEHARGKLLRPYFNPHAARHFFASLMIDMGYSVKLVQERMGHSSPVVTLDLYGHLFRERDAKGDEAKLMEGQIEWNVT